eukprot:COSAG02_NODE_23055_length_731_cov_1.291139_1_plen_141_part_10
MNTSFTVLRARVPCSSSSTGAAAVPGATQSLQGRVAHACTSATKAASMWLLYAAAAAAAAAATAAVGGAATPVPPPTPPPFLANMTMRRYDLNAAKGEVCLDGTPGVFYMRNGTGSGSRKYFVHYQGGGWCESPQDCAASS